MGACISRVLEGLVARWLVPHPLKTGSPNASALRTPVSRLHEGEKSLIQSGSYTIPVANGGRGAAPRVRVADAEHFYSSLSSYIEDASYACQNGPSQHIRFFYNLGKGVPHIPDPGLTGSGPAFHSNHPRPRLISRVGCRIQTPHFCTTRAPTPWTRGCCLNLARVQRSCRVSAGDITEHTRRATRET